MEMCLFLYLHLFEEYVRLAWEALPAELPFQMHAMVPWLKGYSEVLLSFTCADQVALQKQAREQHTICDFILFKSLVV